MAIFRTKRRRRVVVPAIILIALLIVSFRLVEQTGHEKRSGDRFSVTRVLDGDTAELTGGDRLRLLGIDTPESGEVFHDEAKAYLAGLSLNQSCRVEHGGSRRDKYGRMLGFMYVDTVFINRAMVAAGYAYVYIFNDADLKRPEFRQLLDAQKTAMRAGKGIWSVPREKEEYYVNPAGSFRLHRPHCPGIQPPRSGRHHRYATREEGLMEGLSPCRTCKP